MVRYVFGCVFDLHVLANGSSWFGACLGACWVRVSREQEVGREEVEGEEVYRVGEMVVIENDVFSLHCYLSPAIFNIVINTFIVKLRETNSGCCINGDFVGCVLYADDLILISASVNGLQTLLNCCHTVSLDLLL